MPINSLYPMNLLFEAKGNHMMLKTIKENRNQDCIFRIQAKSYPRIPYRTRGNIYETLREKCIHRGQDIKRSGKLMSETTESSTQRK